MTFLKSYWIQIPWWSLKKIYKIIIVASIGAIFIGLLAFYLYMHSLPPLSTWHTTILDSEFTLDSKVTNIKEYMALEEKLFNELDNKIYIKSLSSKHINRYATNSISNPKLWKQNWNKSFEFPVENPRGAVLLIHGMSDSPYSLHSQAEYLHKNGYWVLGLRMPGHGTIPSGLRNVKWQEMATVVRLGMKHLQQKMSTKPIHIMGYSTGAPLALNYTLKALEEKSTLTVPNSLVFYSPAIGVSPAAPFAVWQSRVGHFLGLPKLEWNSLIPEYDPFKYGSFAVNAGDQVYRICNEVQKQFESYETGTKVFPPILSFSSIVDSTVSVPDTINKLYKRLPKGKHTLVLFDINHKFSTNHLVKQSTSHKLAKLRNTSTGDNYTFELITDLNSTDENLMKITDTKTATKLSFAWPKGLYSLSHLAMPISQNDPLYGDIHAPKSPGIQLGHLAIYGENGVLQTSASSLLRQRWNPFHEYTKGRVLEFIK